MQLEEAFRGAGAEFAQSFQTNGTLVYAAEDREAALAILERAIQALQTACGLREPAFISRLQHLVDLVAADPFAEAGTENLYYFSASFMAPDALARLAEPFWMPRRDLEVVQVTDEVLLCVVHKIERRTGDPTSFFEKFLQTKVTTRAWSTIERLVKKLG